MGHRDRPVSDLTLTEFLTARLNDREARARAIHEQRCGTSPELVTDPLGRPIPVECECDWHVVGVLADLAAKRALVERTEWWVEADSFGTAGSVRIAGESIQTVLAQPFAGHADFDPGWKL